MKTWLIDTGPLVAYLDSGDRFHQPVAEQLGPFRGRLVTTSAVITETMHFASASRNGPSLLARFAVDTRLEVYDLAQPTVLVKAAQLMNSYSNLPMDYADATLVLLGQHLKTYLIATLDRRGFNAYRTPAGKSFNQVLSL